MALFSQAGMEAHGQEPMYCSNCHTQMQYNQQINSYRCLTCSSEFWPDEHVVCPRCSKAMKLKPGSAFYSCSRCKGEFWPPDLAGLMSDDDSLVLASYNYGLVYAARIRSKNRKSRCGG